MTEILWIGPIVDPASIKQNVAISPAANWWQTRMVESLIDQGKKVGVIGHIPNQIWPKGPFFVRETTHCKDGVPVRMPAYFNFAFAKSASLNLSYRAAIKKLISKQNKLSIISYNGTSYLRSAIQSCGEYGKIVWTNIVADGDPVEGANRYVFLSDWHMRNNTLERPCIQIEGGIDKRFEGRKKNESEKFVFLYSGTHSKYGGLVELIKAFKEFDEPSVELWVTGKSNGRPAKTLAESDKRIIFLNFLDDAELRSAERCADCFVNPRPLRIEENLQNFPSKLLIYLGYDKPIISTKLPSMPKAYAEVLELCKDESPESLRGALEKVFFGKKYLDCKDISFRNEFRVKRSWEEAARTLCEFALSA